MRPKDIVFPLLMCFLTLATVYRYGVVKKFVESSQEYSFVVEADDVRLSQIKSELQGVTFQKVEQEMIEDGVYRITVKCPPDKVGLLWLLLDKFPSRGGVR